MMQDGPLPDPEIQPINIAIEELKLHFDELMSGAKSDYRDLFEDFIEDLNSIRDKKLSEEEQIKEIFSIIRLKQNLVSLILERRLATKGLTKTILEVPQHFRPVMSIFYRNFNRLEISFKKNAQEGEIRIEFAKAKGEDPEAKLKYQALAATLKQLGIDFKPMHHGFFNPFIAIPLKNLEKINNLAEFERSFKNLYAANHRQLSDEFAEKIVKDMKKLKF